MLRRSFEVLAWGALAALVFVATLTPVSDADLWWHLAAGREMVATRGFLRHDPFTLSAEGRAWIDLHWLFQLWAYGLHQLGGLRAVVIAKALIVTAAALVTMKVVTTGVEPSATSPAGRLTARGLFVVLLASAVYVARHLVLLRPVILTLLFLSLFLLVLERIDRRRTDEAFVWRKWSALWWLPLLQILWVNCQGLFAFGPAVIGAYAVGCWAETRSLRRAGPLFAALGAALLGCFVTPYGLAGVLLPLELLMRVTPRGDNVFSSAIAENIPPWVLERTAPGQFWHLSWALIIVAISFVVGRRQLRLARVLVVLGFAALAMMANRNVLLFYWVAAPVVAMNLAPSGAAIWMRVEAKWLKGIRQPGWVPAVAFLTAVIALAGVVARAAAAETSIAEPSPFRVPAAAIATLPPGSAGQPGRIFAADHYGGYIAWRLYPRHKAFIDTRLVLHTGDEYTDFLGLLDHPERFDEFARRQRFDHVLLPTVYPDRYLGLIQHLLGSPAWRLIFTDGTEVLFARVDNAVGVDNTRATRVDLGDEGQVAQILADLDGRLPTRHAPGRAARRHLARLLLVAGHADRAAQVLTALTAAHPDDSDARVLLARTLVLAGKVPEGEALAHDLIKRHGEWPPALDLLAQVAIARGDGAGALGWLRRSLTVNPHGSEALRLLSALEAAGQKPAP
ncbi:MAG TPA: tetratricopeptide repeat protein [Polyangia bacterium]